MSDYICLTKLYNELINNGHEQLAIPFKGENLMIFSDILNQVKIDDIFTLYKLVQDNQSLIDFDNKNIIENTIDDYFKTQIRSWSNYTEYEDKQIINNYYNILKNTNKKRFKNIIDELKDLKKDTSIKKTKIKIKRNKKSKSSKNLSDSNLSEEVIFSDSLSDSLSDDYNNETKKRLNSFDYKQFIKKHWKLINQNNFWAFYRDEHNEIQSVSKTVYFRNLT